MASRAFLHSMRPKPLNAGVARLSCSAHSKSLFTKNAADLFSTAARPERGGRSNARHPFIAGWAPCR
jgi:hypothetical protein